MITENMRIATLLAFCALMALAGWSVLSLKEEEVQKEEEFVQTYLDDSPPPRPKFNFIEEE